MQFQLLSMSITQEEKKYKSRDKARYFAFLLYPDSSPENVEDKLESLGQPIAISPLHDKDIAEVDKETGEVRYKKEHRHCIYVANNNVTADSVRKKLQRAIGTTAVNLVKICDNIGNYYKYLTHESADAIKKNKHVYDKKDIVHLNNFDIDRYTDLSKEAKDDVFKLACNLIRENGLSNIIMLTEYAINNPECGLTIDKITMLALSYSGGLRLFFDGAYQQEKRKEKR